MSDIESLSSTTTSKSTQTATRTATQTETQTEATTAPTSFIIKEYGTHRICKFQYKIIKMNNVMAVN